MTEFYGKPQRSLHKRSSFSIKNFSSKCDQIRSFLRIGSHLLEKSLMENFIFYAMGVANTLHSSRMENFATIINAF